MFTFGDPSETARLYLDDIVRQVKGPYFAEGHCEEMTLQELDNALIWLWVAVNKAHNTEEDQAVLDVLVQWYDEVFAAHARHSDRLLQLLKKGVHTPPLGVYQREKYVKLAQEASES